MSTENVEVFNKYYGNGVAPQISIGFPYLRREFVKVYLYKKETNEEVMLSSDQFAFINDATIEYPVLPTDEILKEGDILTVQRETELGSDFEFDNQRRLFPVEVMNADDLSFQQIQELAREVKRSVRVTPTAQETPEELLTGVYDKLDSATSIAGEAIAAAGQATIAAEQATTAVEEAKKQVIATQEYIDEKRAEVDTIVAEAEASVDDAITQATEDVKQAALDAAQESIDTAAAQATEIVINYANNDIKPQLNEIAANAEADAENAAESAEIASNESDEAKHWAEDARIWATGEDAEVEEIAPGEEEHSSRGYADLAMAIANTPEDTPIDMSKLLALNVIKGPKGEKGDKGDKGDDGKDGGGLEIGDVAFAVMGIDETKNLRRYLNGQVISQSQFESFTNWVKERAKLYPNTVATEENWQAEVTNSKLGQCGKFVIDDALGTIRLPKVVNVQGLADLSLMGSIKAESLPNIEGKAVAGDGISHSLLIPYNSSGELIGYPSSSTGGSYSTLRGGVLSASNVNSTYQDNAPVQQEAIQYPYFIQVATGVEESVDITREIELNNPFSLLDYKWSEYELNNASWLLSNGAFHSGTVYKAVYELLLKIYNGTETKEGVSVKLSTEAYEDTDFVLNTADTTFRLPVKVKLASGSAVVGNGMTLGLTNGKDNFGLVNQSSVGAVFNNNAYGSNIGASTGTATGDVNIGYGVTTDPTKSGIETSSSGLKLYFYVGETVQDANLINASKVLDLLAKLESYDYVVESKTSTAEDPTWYRVYKSGWVEQGGSVLNATDSATTVVLPKAFSNLNYNVVATSRENDSWDSGDFYIKVSSRSNKSITVTTRIKNFDWEAKGQGDI